MATTIAGVDKQTAARALGAVGAAFGAVSVLAPRVIAAGYGVPPTPQGLQLQRLFGSRALAVSVAGLTARTPEEVDRGLLLVAAMNLLDVLTALGAARGSGRPTTVRAVASSAVYGAAALAVRAMD
ncbi:hypothetical protein LY71_104109 [Geodermatophilus tzadiensis]|uniref:DUF4267 domain-containing protein n=1 Tax=Geodermatophilus tzadiensis TaxID=1137988 RepID=A0A2T0TWN9_9ACTN|nr:hypothetical protein [Geodermatophilus tzadiensis]PRY50073.1 hypothetical protein LY71_104109 [Geodermatophilus tzadiensis]